MLMLGGDEMEKLFDHVGKVTEDDTFKNALDKIENGIKGINYFKKCPKMVKHLAYGLSWWWSKQTGAIGKRIKIKQPEM